MGIILAVLIIVFIVLSIVGKKLQAKQEAIVLLHHDFVRGFLQATRITGVTTVELLVELVAGEDDLIRVEDDDMIAGIDMRGERGLVLAAEDGCHLRRQTSEHHALSVHNVPLTLYGFSLSHIRFHRDSLQ